MAQMKIKTSTKAGKLSVNHNEMRGTKGLRLKTNVKAGRIGIPDNHNETLVRVTKGLRLKTNVKAGSSGDGGDGRLASNHNETLVRSKAIRARRRKAKPTP